MSPTLRVSIDSNAPFLKGGEKQIPFSLSKAINASLVTAQKAQLARMGREFTIRRPQFAKLSVKIVKFAKKASLTGEIAIDPPGDRDDIFAKFEQGGTKKPTGRFLAIPITGSPVKKTARTIVAEKNRPKALLSGQTHTAQGAPIKRAKSFGGAFFLPPRDGKAAGIFIRAGKKVKLAYTLQPKAELKPELHFVDTITHSVRDTFSEDFAREFAKAVKTAKP